MKEKKAKEIAHTVEVYLENPVDFMEMYSTWVYGSFRRISEDRIQPNQLHDFECGNNFWQNLFKNIHTNP